MSLTLAEVEHIAELARLELADCEKVLDCEQLSAILGYRGWDRVFGTE